MITPGLGLYKYTWVRHQEHIEQQFVDHTHTQRSRKVSL